MLGKELVKVFSKTDFFALSRQDLDICNREEVFRQFMTIAPNVVINAAAYTNVDKAEVEEELAQSVNGYAAGILAQACREIDAVYVHVSTDYVFDGKKKRGYTEEDALNPLNAYGRSKALGEYLIQEEMEMINEYAVKEGRYYIVRTSWLFSEGGKNFVNSIFKRAKETGLVTVVNDQFGRPTYAPDLAKQIKWLVESNDYPSGIYHITNSEVASWFEFAVEIIKQSKLDAKVIPCSTAEHIERVKSSSNGLVTVAERPACSILLNNKLPELRSYKDALADYFFNINKNEN